MQTSYLMNRCAWSWADAFAKYISFLGEINRSALTSGQTNSVIHWARLNILIRSEFQISWYFNPVCFQFNIECPVND
jgi:hypothetical protein